MKRLLSLLLLALPAWGQVNVVTAPCNMTDGSCGASSYSTMPAPTGCVATSVPVFLGSPVALACSTLTYDSTTGTLGAPTVSARNVTVTALATPTITSVTPVLTKVATITTVAGSALVDGDYFTIKYASGLTVPIQFDLSPGDGTTGGMVPLLFTALDSADTIRDNIIAALNAAAGTQLTASSGGAATVAIVLDTPGAAGDTNTEAVANAGFAVTGFSNPTAATTYGYKVVALLASGETTAASAEVTTAAGHATLSAANYNAVTWGAVTGASSYRLYRTTGGAAPPKLIYTGALLNFSDIGAAGTAETPATANTTGVVTAATVASSGAVTGTTITGSSTVTGSALAIITSNGASFTVASAGRLITTVNTVGVAQTRAAGGSYGFTLRNDADLSWYPNTTVTGMGAPDMYLTRGAAATLQLGAANSATPVSQTLRPQGGAGTNIAGAATFTIETPRGTGEGAPGKISFVAAQKGTTGTTVHTVTERLGIKELTVSLPGLPVYADNTAALAGSLVAGDVYRTSTGVLMVTY